MIIVNKFRLYKAREKMEQDINKYLNKIGRWWLEDASDEIFYAQLVEEKDNYSLISEVININLLRLLGTKQDEKYGELTIHGEIEGVKFSLLKSNYQE